MDARIATAQNAHLATAVQTHLQTLGPKRAAVLGQAVVNARQTSVTWYEQQLKAWRLNNIYAIRHSAQWRQSS